MWISNCLDTMSQSRSPSHRLTNYSHSSKGLERWLTEVQKIAKYEILNVLVVFHGPYHCYYMSMSFVNISLLGYINFTYFSLKSFIYKKMHLFIFCPCSINITISTWKYMILVYETRLKPSIWPVLFAECVWGFFVVVVGFCFLAYVF